MNTQRLMLLAARGRTAGSLARAALSGDGEALGPLSDCLLEENDVQSLTVGQTYFVQTVTHYYTGRLEAVTFAEIVLSDAAWIFDTGRFADFFVSGNPKECEPLPDGVRLTLNMGCVVSVIEFPHKLPRKQV